MKNKFDFLPVSLLYTYTACNFEPDHFQRNETKMILFALFALAAPECLKWAKSDHSEKTIEVDCDSSTFNFIQKCYNVWDNVEDGNVDFFWTPLGTRKVFEF